MQLYVKPDVCSSTMPSAAFVGHVSDPLSVLKAFALSLSRLEQAIHLEHWAIAWNDLRRPMGISLGLAAWWTFLVLRAPLCVWPFLFVILMPPFAWKLRGVVQRDPPHGSRCLYVDEM